MANQESAVRNPQSAIMPSNNPTPPRSPWPHRWAWLLACATFPLVWWGGFVTATGSGMAFRDWLTADGTFLPLYPWFSAAGDKFIEHGHRVLAMLAGVLTIALVIVCSRCEPRRWARIYSWALMGGVIGQGVLGGLRVVLDERVLALVHGCVGPLFFAATAGMVAITSPAWAASTQQSTVVSAKLIRLATLTAALAYLQLVLGAVVRHSPHMLSENAETIFRIAVYFHLLLAAAVTFHIVWLAVRCWRSKAATGGAVALVALVGVQILLGASSWVVKYGMPSWATQLVGETGHFNRASDFASAAILAGHGAIGSLIVAISVVIALRVVRLRHGASLDAANPITPPANLFAGVLA
jgi:cytochrome c oxidase assembly protein subunit 15